MHYIFKKQQGKVKQFMIVLNGRKMLAQFNKKKRKWVVSYQDSVGTKNTPNKFKLGYFGNKVFGVQMKLSQRLKFPFLQKEIQGLYAEGMQNLMSVNKITAAL